MGNDENKKKYISKEEKREIMQLSLDLTNKAIAEKTGISQATVAYHAAKVRKSFRATKRKQRKVLPVKHKQKNVVGHEGENAGVYIGDDLKKENKKLKLELIKTQAQIEVLERLLKEKL